MVLEVSGSDRLAHYCFGPCGEEQRASWWGAESIMVGSRGHHGGKQRTSWWGAQGIMGGAESYTDCSQEAEERKRKELEPHGAPKGTSEVVT